MMYSALNKRWSCSRNNLSENTQSYSHNRPKKYTKALRNTSTCNWVDPRTELYTYPPQCSQTWTSAPGIPRNLEPLFLAHLTPELLTFNRLPCPARPGSQMSPSSFTKFSPTFSTPLGTCTPASSSAAAVICWQCHPRVATQRPKTQRPQSQSRPQSDSSFIYPDDPGIRGWTARPWRINLDVADGKTSSRRLASAGGCLCQLLVEDAHAPGAVATWLDSEWRYVGSIWKTHAHPNRYPALLRYKHPPPNRSWVLPQSVLPDNVTRLRFTALN